MLDLIYITHLHPGKQRTLAYAFGLAKALSSPLSLLSSANLGEPESGKMSIWTPKNREVQDSLRAGYKPIKYRQRNKRLPLYILGKSSQTARRECSSYQIIQRLLDLGFPLLILPFDQPFTGIRNVLFAGNAPGLTDHRLKHFIAATFLPRAFQFENARLKRIHWNNISHIPRKHSASIDFDSPDLKAEIEQRKIDLTIFPISHSTSGERKNKAILRQITAAQHPILLLPLLAETLTFVGETDSLQLAD